MEKFVRTSSIDFYKKMSVTYLVNDENDRLAGIFTLTHKAIDILIKFGINRRQRTALCLLKSAYQIA